jgi:glutamate-1-semialdehyde 2,1-aminomutase
MAAGLATLAITERDGVRQRLEALGARLERALVPILAAAGEPVQLVRQGSIFWLALQSGEPPRAAERVESGAAKRYASLFHALLARGIMLAPSAYEVGFLSAAHTEADVERLAAAIGEALAATGATA